MPLPQSLILMLWRMIGCDFEGYLFYGRVPAAGPPPSLSGKDGTRLVHRRVGSCWTVARRNRPPREQKRLQLSFCWRALELHAIHFHVYFSAVNKEQRNKPDTCKARVLSFTKRSTQRETSLLFFGRVRLSKVWGELVKARIVYYEEDFIWIWLGS